MLYPPFFGDWPLQKGRGASRFPPGRPSELSQVQGQQLETSISGSKGADSDGCQARKNFRVPGVPVERFCSSFGYPIFGETLLQGFSKHGSHFHWWILLNPQENPGENGAHFWTEPFFPGLLDMRPSTTLRRKQMASRVEWWWSQRT